MENEDRNEDSTEQSDGSLAKEPENSADELAIEVKTEASSSEDKTKKMIMRLLESRSMFSGPLPPPEVLKAYDLVESGLAREIVDMAKRQSQHRMDMESVVIVGDSKRSWLGLVLGFVISCLFLGSSTYLIMEGHDIAGGTLATTALVSLVGTFIYGSNQRAKERVEKQKALLEADIEEETMEDD